MSEFGKRQTQGLGRPPGTGDCQTEKFCAALQEDCSAAQ
jgi:hypothetical protein